MNNRFGMDLEAVIKKIVSRPPLSRHAFTEFPAHNPRDRKFADVNLLEDVPDTMPVLPTKGERK